MTTKIQQIPKIHFLLILISLYNSKSSMETHKRILLPSGVSPKKYYLALQPNLMNFTFLGNVNIELEVSKSSEQIVLHSSELSFSNVTVTQGNSEKVVDLNSIIFDETEETATIPVTLEKDFATLQIKFEGSINDKMKGFYRSVFNDDSGSERKVACTQFEATDARRAFPCWDEPEHKATFDLSITTDKKLTVISNTPIEHEEELEYNLKRVVFESTPVMSTYLLAWLIAENYDSLSLKTKNGIEISTYAPKDELYKTKYALEVADKTLTHFEEYFGINYPLQKLDMVVLKDFVNGAMENWGLVTYRDTAIYSDEFSSEKAREWVASVVAHELAHQWFGNLVTMKWWSHLWLNEGFATFMQGLANDEIYPDMKIWHEFLSNTLERALELDSLKNSHPVEVPIKHTKEINEVFDVISYKKGCALLRMLHEYIGKECFQKGVSNYLNKYRYSNTESDDLWLSLEKASEGKQVRNFMHIYTNKTGYPLVEVDILKKKENLYTVRLKQRRFLKNGKKIKDNTVWEIPMKIDISGKINWLVMKSQTLEKDYEIKNFQYIRFNSGSNGFFRVKQSKEILKGLIKAMKNSKLSTSDRYMILSDIKALFIAGEEEAKEVLEMLEKYLEEDDLTVWSIILSTLETIKIVTVEDSDQTSDSQKSFNKFAIRLLEKISKKLGKKFEKSDPARIKKLRAQIIGFLARSEDKTTIEFLKKKYEDLKENILKADSNIFGSIIANAVRQGGVKEFEQVKKIGQETNDPLKKIQCLMALGESKNSKILKKALDYFLSGKIRNQDAFYLFSSVSTNKNGIELAWKFFKKEYNILRATYVHDTLFSRLVMVVGFMRKSEMINDAEKFFAKKNIKGYEKALAQSLEKAKLNLGFRNREKAKVEQWLKSKGY